MRWVMLVAVLGLAGCVATTESQQPTQRAPSQPAPVTKASAPSNSDMARFRSVVRRVEPVAERVCRSEQRNRKCDFKIVVDDRPGLPPNAYQTIDKSGRPILAFTLAMIADVRNSDELAFVLSHEAAHHIADHIPRQQQNAMAGAILLGGLATLAGGNSAAVDAALDLGAGLGARSYSKDFELEADAIGTVIAHESGYDPVRGAAFFTQIPDPGNRFLGTHPPNAERINTVRRVAATL